MTPVVLLVVGALGVQTGAPQTGRLQTFAVPAELAAASVNRLAAQAGIDVVIAPEVASRRTPEVNGRLSLDAAFERLLTPVGARAVRIGERMYRIEAAPARRPAAPARPRAEGPTTDLGEVIVTALPPVGLTDIPGRGLVDPGGLERVEGGPASDAIADLTATVDSTRQGAGRNKLFIRGLADSAMNGPLQATVGQYLGDLRLNYGSPDPDLALIDIRRIEVFEGPQGTRFGVGAIGGILRIQPEPPAPGETSGRFIAGAGVTSGGAESGDLALILNGPIGERLTARVVAYARRDGGFLDRPLEGLRATDHVETTGGRSALRWTDAVWTIDVTGLAQKISAGDAQTVNAGAVSFARTNRVREPYESAVTLVGVTASRHLGSIRLTSATSLSRQTLDERFDATQPSDAAPGVVDRRQTALSASSEVRLEATSREGFGWLAGAALAVGETRAVRRRRDLSQTPGPVYGADLTRQFSEATVFGEASIAPAPNWRLAAGARLSAVRVDTDIRDVQVGARAASDRNGTSVRVTPSLSARWDALPDLTAFARLEQAVRPAGFSEANGAFERYNGDQVTLTEIGLRSAGWRAGLAGEVSAGWVDWRDVQADIVTPGGDLVTDNVGDGRIRFLSIKASWSPTSDLEVSGGLFVNDSRLTPTRFSIIGGGRTDIPNVAPLGAQMSLGWRAGTLSGLPLRLGADLRYVGQSRLGVGPMLDVPQGGYLRTELTGRLGDDRRAWTLRLSNPFDAEGVRYGIGSPYQLYAPQTVPVRPLTVRLGFEARF